MRRYKFSVLDNLKLKSYAKINLYLHVLNKRDDGFHNISSLLSRIDLYDSITFEKSEIFEVEYSGPEGNKVSNDNITQLITYLKNEKIIDELNYRIKINKNIPIGAGSPFDAAHQTPLGQACHHISSGVGTDRKHAAVHFYPCGQSQRTGVVVNGCQHVSRCAVATDKNQ